MALDTCRRRLLRCSGPLPHVALASVFHVAGEDARTYARRLDGRRRRTDSAAIPGARRSLLPGAGERETGALAVGRVRRFWVFGFSIWIEQTDERVLRTGRNG